MNSDKMNDKKDLRIEKLPLSARSFNWLYRAGVRTVGDILNFKSMAEMMSVPKLGRVSCNDIVCVIADLGFEEWAEKMWEDNPWVWKIEFERMNLNEIGNS